MDKHEFTTLRKKLGKTQKKIAELLGISVKTIHSYEQGRRTIPSYIERHLYFLLVHQRGKEKTLTPCWEKKDCKLKEDCPAYEFQSGHLCWFLCGTLCDCTQHVSCKEKIQTCRSCEILTSFIE